MRGETRSGNIPGAEYSRRFGAIEIRAGLEERLKISGRVLKLL
jgi:hypothetical protein